MFCCDMKRLELSYLDRDFFNTAFFLLEVIFWVS